MENSPSGIILYTLEYIPGIFYFATARCGVPMQCDAGFYYFSIDDELVYQNFYSDFGPLNLGCIYKYCCKLNEIFRVHLRTKKVVHFTSTDPRKKANAAFLIGCYGVLCLELSPRDAFRALCTHGQTYKPFQDATQGDSLYTITILDCLNGIAKARDLGLFNLLDFDVQEYDRLDNIRGGDLNWIVPGKFLAFIGPVEHAISPYHPPEIYIEYFLENDVRIVIRLNRKFYDESVFDKAGIKHYDMFFPDGSCPPRHIVYKFLQLAEESPGIAIAVHCKAGLGRTGSLIGCYLIKHYKMSAREAIGWMRICRPGSVIGHQQGWLEQLEPWLVKEGVQYRKKVWNDRNKLPYHEFGVYSLKKCKWHEEWKVLPNVPSQKINITVPRTETFTKFEIAKELSKSEENSEDLEHEHMENQPKKLSRNSSLNRGSPIRERQFSSENQNLQYVSTTKSRSPSRPASARNVKSRNETTGNKPQNPSDRGRSRVPGESSQRTSTRQSTVQVRTIKNNASPPPSSLQCTVVPTDFVKENITNCIRGANKEALGSYLKNGSRSPSPIYRRQRVSNRESFAAPSQESPASKKSQPNQQTQPNTNYNHTRTSNMRLRALANRDRSIGAASLDARRQQLATPERSVRSDDISRVTQGDFLNSIKFERQLRKVTQRQKEIPQQQPVQQQAVQPSQHSIQQEQKQVFLQLQPPTSPLRGSRKTNNRSSALSPVRTRLSEPGKVTRERITPATGTISQQKDNNNQNSVYSQRNNWSSPRAIQRASSPMRNKAYSADNPDPWRHYTTKTVKSYAKRPEY